MKITSYFASAILFSLMVGFASSCSEDENPSSDSGFNRKAMLTNIGSNIIIPSYALLENEVILLDQDVAAFVANPSVVNLNTLRSQFLSAYTSWQAVSVYELGPAMQENLRLNLNTFPTDVAQIQANISSGSYSLGTAANLDAKGLPAIDYLLFGSADTDDAIVAKFSDAADAASRRKYLQDIAGEIKAKVNAVTTGWSPDGGNYLSTFENNTGTDAGSSLSLIVNQLNYDWEIIKNPKIGIPLGKKSLGEPQPAKVEALYSKHSVMLARLNAEAIQRLYLGKTVAGADGLGLDDYLDHVNAQNGQLATAIKERFTATIQKISTLPEPMSETIINDPAMVEAVYDEIQSTLVLLKTDMTSALGVAISYTDNDGD